LQALSGAVIAEAHDRRAISDAVFESLSLEDDTELSSAARWTLEALAGQPRLFDQVAPEISSQLINARIFAINSIRSLDDGEITKGRWQLNLVESPLHEAETPPAMTKAVGSRRARSPEWETASKALGDEFDPSRIGPPHRPLHLGVIGTTGMPLVPRTLLLPAGLDAAFAALEVAVEQAWHSFREWGARAGLPLPPADTASPWVVDDDDASLDRFLIQLVGAWSAGRLSLSPPSSPPATGLTSIHRLLLTSTGRRA
jgi:hypothetical protein